MSVNAPNIFSKIFLTSSIDALPALSETERAVLIVDAGSDWNAIAPQLQTLGAGIPRSCALYLRLDALADGCESVLADILTGNMEGIVLTNCAGTSHIQELETRLRVAEAVADRPDGSTRIIAELGGSTKAFLPPRPLLSTRLSALIFNEDAAICATGTQPAKNANGVIGSMRTATVLMAAQANVPCFLMGDDSARDFEDRIVQRLGRNISKTSPASQ